MNLEEGSLSSHGTSPSEVRENFTENIVLERRFKERAEVCQVKQRGKQRGSKDSRKTTTGQNTHEGRGGEKL